MADRIRRVDYYYALVPDQPGEGFRVLSKLKEAGVNLLSFTAFPAEKGKTQVDFVSEDGALLAKAAKAAGLTLSPKKQAFFIQGNDRPGAVVNVHATNASCGANGGYGMILWVKPQQVEAAGKALGV